MPDKITRDWTAKTGFYAMRFNYPPERAQVEQRLSLGAGRNDIWVSYWIRVRTNFYYRPAFPDNGKFFTLWMDKYAANSDDPTVFVGLWSDGS